MGCDADCRAVIRARRYRKERRSKSVIGSTAQSKTGETEKNAPFVAPPAEQIVPAVEPVVPAVVPVVPGVVPVAAAVVPVVEADERKMSVKTVPDEDVAEEGTSLEEESTSEERVLQIPWEADTNVQEA